VGQRGRACPVCAGDQMQLEQVNAMLSAGSGASALAKLFPFSRDTLQRHKKHAFPSPALSVDLGEPGDEIALSNARLARWLERSESAYTASARSGDLRSLIESLRSGIRSELELRRRLERKVEQASSSDLPPEKGGAVTIDFLDLCVAKVRAANAARGLPPCPLCGHGQVSLAEIATKLPAVILEVEKYELEHGGTRNPN
jgi:hypothetical protein